MILEHKKFDLYNRMAFEKATMIPPFTMKALMQNEACFFYILNGATKGMGEVESLITRKNEGVLFKCGNFISQVIDEGEGEQVEAIAIHFYPEVLKKIYESGLPHFLKKPKNALPSSTMAVVKNDAIIHKYIESLIFYFENPELADEELLILKLKELLLLLSKTSHSSKVHDILSHLFSPQSFELKEIIEANLYSDLSLDQLAELSNMSLSSFKRSFSKVYNCSPANYIKNKKLEKAANLLETTDLPVSTVGFDCGFNNLAHFSKCFKQKFNLSPSKYRMTHIDKSLN